MKLIITRLSKIGGMEKNCKHCLQEWMCFLTMNFTIPSVAANGQSFTLNFGTLTNINTDNSILETIAVVYTVVVTQYSSGLGSYTLTVGG